MQIKLENRILHDLIFVGIISLNHENSTWRVFPVNSLSLAQYTDEEWGPTLKNAG